MTRLFLVPLLLALLWLIALLWLRVPLRQGAKGFYWIIGLGGGMAAVGIPEQARTIALIPWGDDDPLAG